MVFTYETVRDLGMLGGWTNSYPLATEREDGTVAQGLTNIEAIDDYTVKVTFNFDPGLSVWQYGVASASFVAEHYWSQYATDRETLLAAPVDGVPVAGAFEYGTLEKGAFYTWKYDTDTMFFGGENTVYANGGVSYSNDNGVAPAISYEFGDLSGDSISWTDGPFVGTVEFSLYGDQDAAYLAFQSGEVDFVLNPLGLKRNALEALISQGDVEVITNQSNGFRYMAFNTREGKFPTDNKAFRQAVSCIVDKDYIIESILAGAVINMDGVMPPALTSWVSPVQGVLAECNDMNFEKMEQVN
jgi:ABC-type transport system substrate-binding protein